jgi:predicted esterase
VATQTRTYDEYYNEAMEHYGKGEFGTVYELITAGEAQYPDHEAEILYLRSCMAARTGENTLALGLIRDALDRGIWYGEGIMRRTPSWQPLQGLPEFEELVKVCKAQEIASNVGPLLLLSEPDGGCSPADPCPVLVALHGNGDNGQRALNGWRSVVEQGWLLAAAQSSQAGMTGFYIWDDQEIALRELAVHYATLRDGQSIDLERVVIAGFSMGGETALRAALLGTIPARGFILLGPGGPTIDTPDEWLPLMAGAKERGLRGYVFLGENDNTVPHDEIRAIVSSLNAQGIPCELETVPAIAHEYPIDFGSMIKRALAFILSK